MIASASGAAVFCALTRTRTAPAPRTTGTARVRVSFTVTDWLAETSSLRAVTT